MFDYNFKKSIEKNFNELEKFNYLKNFNELKNLLLTISENERYLFVSKNIDFNAQPLMDKPKNHSKFIINAYNGLESLKYWIKLSIMDYNFFVGVYSIIMYSCSCSYGRPMDIMGFEYLLHSNLPYKLTVYLDDFDKYDDFSNLSEEFFRTIRDMKLDKNANEIEKIIYRKFWSNLTINYGTENRVDVQFAYCANYLSRCYAFNRGRNVVSVEDIADAWILTLKLFLNDLRQYINGLESNSPCASLPSVNSYRNIEVDNDNSSGFNVKKIFAILLSILFFSLIIIVFQYTVNLLTGNYYYPKSPHGRYVLAGISLFPTSIFYGIVKKILKV